MSNLKTLLQYKYYIVSTIKITPHMRLEKCFSAKWTDTPPFHPCCTPRPDIKNNFLKIFSSTLPEKIPPLLLKRWKQKESHFFLAQIDLIFPYPFFPSLLSLHYQIHHNSYRYSNLATSVFARVRILFFFFLYL